VISPIYYRAIIVSKLKPTITLIQASDDVGFFFNIFYVHKHLFGFIFSSYPTKCYNKYDENF
ncbi:MULTISPECIES: hypothetical protein, partial [unclassified Staphylococcus]